MIKEFKNESQAKAVAASLGLLITKYKGVYIVSNNKEELLANYNLGYHQRGGIFYDEKVFEIDENDNIVIRDKLLVDASSIELPYEIIDCSHMFSNCISLKIPPTIPKGVKTCDSMFRDCTFLKEAPEIPEGVQNCSYMFCGCTSLKTPSEIPEGAFNCCAMFYCCTSLVTPPIIPESVKDCAYMFGGCSSLKEPPEIPEGVKNCSYMFTYCTSLKTPPHFPKNCDTNGALSDTPFERS